MSFTNNDDLSDDHNEMVSILYLLTSKWQEFASNNANNKIPTTILANLHNKWQSHW